jgi:hypothetical protein
MLVGIFRRFSHRLVGCRFFLFSIVKFRRLVGPSWPLLVFLDSNLWHLIFIFDRPSAYPALAQNDALYCAFAWNFARFFLCTDAMATCWWMSLTP